MNADDPRHGTTAGYNAGCREACCRTAIADWTRHYRTRQYIHGPLSVDDTGTRRRIQALMALGWSAPQLDAALGRRRTYTTAVLAGSGTVLRATADMYAALYERLCMTPPPTTTRYEKQRTTRVRNYAARMGWAPPLAWDDIDRDAAPTGITPGDEEDVDRAVVERILAGDNRVAANPAERREVVQRWVEVGRPVNELARLTGWKVERYGRVAA